MQSRGEEKGTREQRRGNKAENTVRVMSDLQIITCWHAGGDIADAEMWPGQ